MCSVRQRPIPVAPKAMAVSVCLGESALVRTFIFVQSSHHCMSLAKFW